MPDAAYERGSGHPAPDPGGGFRTRVSFFLHSPWTMGLGTVVFPSPPKPTPRNRSKRARVKGDASRPLALSLMGCGRASPLVQDGGPLRGARFERMVWISDDGSARGMVDPLDITTHWVN